ncbi:hypothetical protein DS544_25350 [Salmonella enterica subsp. enterica serovar Abony]|nr:hypothetical protein [Salmonella enterica subsp. enterica serovar Abony]
MTGLVDILQILKGRTILFLQKRGLNIQTALQDLLVCLKPQVEIMVGVVLNTPVSHGGEI